MSAIITTHWDKAPTRAYRVRKSLKVLKVEVKVIFSVFLAIFLLKFSLKIIAREAREEKNEKT